MSVPFTQYLRPDGRKRAQEIDRTPEVEALARGFIGAGGYFEIEELRTGHVSLTAGMNGEDLAIELEDNQPGLVGPAVDRLVRRAVAEQLRRKVAPDDLPEAREVATSMEAFGKAAAEMMSGAVSDEEAEGDPW